MATDITLHIENLEKLRALLDDSVYFENSDDSHQEKLEVSKIIEARKVSPSFEIQLAKFICGDIQGVKEASPFPYRSSSQITEFFQRIYLPFQHNGETRRFWIEEILKRLNSADLLRVIKNLFRLEDFQKDFDQPNVPWEVRFNQAQEEFRRFMDSCKPSRDRIDISYILGLNINASLLFDEEVHSEDEVLNELLEEAKKRYTRQGDLHIAVEKLWDVLERLKTVLDSKKKSGVQLLLQRVNENISAEKLDEEFQELSRIGNTHRIRHHETDKSELSFEELRYLFFRCLALVNYCLKRVEQTKSAS